MFDSILSQINPVVIYIVVAILLVSMILALVKRVIKIAVIVFAVACMVMFLGPIATEFQKNNSINVTSSEVDLKVSGTSYKITKKDLSSIDLVSKGISGYNITVNYKNGVSTFIVPGYMESAIKTFADKNSITVKETD